MTNGIFERLGAYSYARATTVMSTQSETVFEWSVKLIGTCHVAVGIASKLAPFRTIFRYDQEAIFYYSPDIASEMATDIRRGLTSIHSNLRKPKSGDMVRFKFHPGAKKLIIYWVRKRDSSSTNL